MRCEERARTCSGECAFQYPSAVMAVRAVQLVDCSYVVWPLSALSQDETLPLIRAGPDITQRSTVTARVSDPCTADSNTTQLQSAATLARPPALLEPEVVVMLFDANWGACACGPARR